MDGTGQTNCNKDVWLGCTGKKEEPRFGFRVHHHNLKMVGGGGEKFESGDGYSMGGGRNTSQRKDTQVWGVRCCPA